MNRRPLTQDYFDFILDRSRVQGQLDMLEEVTKLVKDGMDISKAVQYQIDRINKEVKRLQPIQQYYEGV